MAIWMIILDVLCFNNLSRALTLESSLISLHLVHDVSRISYPIELNEIKIKILGYSSYARPMGSGG